jgi:hypothetical protein
MTSKGIDTRRARLARPQTVIVIVVAAYVVIRP